jgi:hypothetical protein
MTECVNGRWLVYRDARFVFVVCFICLFVCCSNRNLTNYCNQTSTASLHHDANYLPERERYYCAPRKARDIVLDEIDDDDDSYDELLSPRPSSSSSSSMLLLIDGERAAEARARRVAARLARRTVHDSDSDDDDDDDDDYDDADDDAVDKDKGGGKDNRVSSSLSLLDDNSEDGLIHSAYADLQHISTTAE